MLGRVADLGGHWLRWPLRALLPPAARVAFPTRAAAPYGPHDAAQPLVACACVACAHGLRQNKFNDVTLSGAVTVSATASSQVDLRD